MLPIAVTLSVFVGIILGMLGGGGSILTLPILLYVLRMDQKEAIATSLIVVGTTSIIAMLPHARNRNVDLRIGLSFAGAGSIGAFLGGLLSEYLPGTLLISGFVATMILAGLAMLRGNRNAASGAVRMSRILLIGLGAGLLTGLVGAGGGFIVVPALTLFGGLEMRKAVGTSLLVIGLNTFAGYLGHAAHNPVNFGITGMMTLAAVVGSVLGGLLSGLIPQPLLKRGFGIFVIGVAFYMGFQQIS